MNYTIKDDQRMQQSKQEQNPEKTSWNYLPKDSKAHK